MDARELAEKVLVNMTSGEIADILSTGSAKNFELGIELIILARRYKEIEASDVVREIEGMLGV